MAIRSPTIWTRTSSRRKNRGFSNELPIVVGLSAQLAGPGAFLANDDCGVPILVVRQADGGLRAFINACRHRGTLLVSVHKRGVFAGVLGWPQAAGAGLVQFLISSDGIFPT